MKSKICLISLNYLLIGAFESQFLSQLPSRLKTYTKYTFLVLHFATTRMVVLLSKSNYKENEPKQDVCMTNSSLPTRNRHIPSHMYLLVSNQEKSVKRVWLNNFNKKLEFDKSLFQTLPSVKPLCLFDRIMRKYICIYLFILRDGSGNQN